MDCVGLLEASDTLFDLASPLNCKKLLTADYHCGYEVE